MDKTEELIWSNTDFPYMCLIDKKRTQAFREAIKKVVKPGDVVIDVGSGTGIFALFAAEAGAAKVYAVEIESLLAKSLRETVVANHYSKIIEVVEGDALEANLPENVDVVIAELIETGLMDEMQVPVMNALIKKGIVGGKTKLIPQAYQTNLQLVNIDHTFYGHTIKTPKHLWPFYKLDSNEWLSPKVTPLSNKIKVVDLDLRQINELSVDETLTFKLKNQDQPINGISITGVLTLTDGLELREANSLNGEKILSLPESIKHTNGEIKMRVTYKMGAGMGSFKAEQV